MDIKVKSQNREGETIIYETSDLLSRVMQHEIDHLNGIYFFDRLARLKRELLVNKIKKEFVVNK